MSDSINFRGKVLFTENFGSFFVANISIGENIFVKAISKENISRLSEINFSFPLESLFIFDCNGNRL
jgi:hypothetical protein